MLKIAGMIIMGAKGLVELVISEGNPCFEFMFCSNPISEKTTINKEIQANTNLHQRLSEL